MLNCSMLRSALYALMFAASSTWAIDLKYQATDLADVVSGNDRWLYDYTLVGSFAEFEGVKLKYSATSYADLVLESEPDATAFASSLVQPDPALPADGLVSLSANRAISTEIFAFSVSFDWLGTSPPGPQPFETFDADFNITSPQPDPMTAPVPEPTTWLLMLAGIAGLVVRRRLLHSVLH